MEKEYIEKILKLFKAGKIVINENGNLAFTADYVKAKNKKQITGPNKDKKKSYSSDTVKLSKKVYFSVLKSGEFRLRGGRKAALELRESIKKEVEGKRIGENRRKIDSAILNMIDAYENKLRNSSVLKQYAANLDNEQQNKDFKITSVNQNDSQYGEDFEMHSKYIPFVTIDDKTKRKLSYYSLIKPIKNKMEKINDEFKQKQPKNKLTYKELIEPRKIQSELLSHEPHSQHAKETYYKKLYNMLNESQKEKVLLTYLKCKKRINPLDKFLLKVNRKKYVESLCQDISRMYDVKDCLTYYIEYNLTKNSKPTKKAKQQKEKYNNLTKTQKYNLRLENFRRTEHRDANPFEKMVLFFSKNARDKEVLSDIYYNPNLTTNSIFNSFIQDDKDSDSKPKSFKIRRAETINSLRKDLPTNFFPKVVSKESNSVQQKSQSPEDRIQFQ